MVNEGMINLHLSFNRQLGIIWAQKFQQAEGSIRLWFWFSWQVGRGAVGGMALLGSSTFAK